jgi:hypothetical protein
MNPHEHQVFCKHLLGIADFLHSVDGRLPGRPRRQPVTHLLLSILLCLGARMHGWCFKASESVALDLTASSRELRSSEIFISEPERHGQSSKSQFDHLPHLEGNQGIPTIAISHLRSESKCRRQITATSRSTPTPTPFAHMDAADPIYTHHAPLYNSDYPILSDFAP